MFTVRYNSPIIQICTKNHMCEGATSNHIIDTDDCKRNCYWFRVGILKKCLR